jgi:ATP-dependent DNA helicase RecG
MDSKHFTGNAFQILSEANFFNMRHLPVESFFESDQGQRIDKPALPVIAIREALINAICHRDYRNRSSSISYAIYDDRLEIWNNGTLPPELKIKDLKKPHESYPRNKKIVAVFKNRGWIEKSGTGTLRMIEECRKHGISEPKFEEYSGGFSVTFRFRELIGAPTEKRNAKSELSTRQESILAMIKERGPIGIKQIMLTLENPPSRRMILKDLKNLKELGLLEMKGHTTSTVWVLKDDE